jgi:hypothetical protein
MKPTGASRALGKVSDSATLTGQNRLVTGENLADETGRAVEVVGQALAAAGYQPRCTHEQNGRAYTMTPTEPCAMAS